MLPAALNALRPADSPPGYTEGMPSSVVKTTSVVSPLIIRVAGATMISLRRSITSLRVRIRTGRRLSGKPNVYQRISPRFNRCSPSPRLPRQAIPHRTKTHRAEVGLTDRRIRFLAPARKSDAGAARVRWALTRQPAEECRRQSELCPSLKILTPTTAYSVCAYNAIRFAVQSHHCC